MYYLIYLASLSFMVLSSEEPGLSVLPVVGVVLLVDDVDVEEEVGTVAGVVDDDAPSALRSVSAIF